MRDQATEHAKEASLIVVNALGHLFEYLFRLPESPCHTYSELVRRSGVSRNSIQHYISARPGWARSPHIPELEALAEAIQVPFELLCRAALPNSSFSYEQYQTAQNRGQEMAPLLEKLTEEQFQAFLTMLRMLLATPRQIAPS